MPIINSKDTFRKVCLELLPELRKKDIPKLQEKSEKCAVFIDCREIPHLEYIFRQAISCLDDTWSMHIFTGNKNNKFMRDVCEKNNINAKITNLGMDNMMVDEYSLLLLSEEFWNKIDAEKVLIFQEDSTLFRKGIDKFLQYDYVGAPWPPWCKNSPNNIGNGGLSLRSKSKSLEIIKKVKIFDDMTSESTKEYMRRMGLRVIPEDVYFSYGMSLIGAKMPTFDDAREFSVETMFHPNPIAGHQFWISHGGHKLQSNMRKHLKTLKDK